MQADGHTNATWEVDNEQDSDTTRGLGGGDGGPLCGERGAGRPGLLGLDPDHGVPTAAAPGATGVCDVRHPRLADRRGLFSVCRAA